MRIAGKTRADKIAATDADWRSERIDSARLAFDLRRRAYGIRPSHRDWRHASRAPIAESYVDASPMSAMASFCDHGIITLRVGNDFRHEAVSVAALIWPGRESCTPTRAAARIVVTVCESHGLCQTLAAIGVLQSAALQTARRAARQRLRLT